MQTIYDSRNSFKYFQNTMGKSYLFDFIFKIIIDNQKNLLDPTKIVEYNNA